MIQVQSSPVFAEDFASAGLPSGLQRSPYTANYFVISQYGGCQYLSLAPCTDLLPVQYGLFYLPGLPVAAYKHYYVALGSPG